jgi:FkbM family methyltransferase
MNRAARATRILRPLVNVLLPSRPIRVTVRSGPARGMKIVIDPQRERAYWTGRYEPAVQGVLVDLLQPGMAVWDIGAHAGFFTALCSRCVGPSGRVYSFEPSSQTRARLEQTIALNGLENVRVLPFAVAAERGAGVLYDAGRSAQATLRAAKTSSDASQVEVRALPDLWEELGAPDVIKIDAEGAEVAIIEGGADLLSSSSVRLVVEIHREKARARIFELVRDRDQIDERHWLLRPGG